MWRLWTRGWGPRDWWYWFRTEGLPLWIAWRLPRRVALWTFIRVYSADGCSPGPEYCRVYDAWERGEPIRRKHLIVMQDSSPTLAQQQDDKSE